MAGACEFIGGHIVDELARHDVEVVALIRPGASVERLAELGLTIVRAHHTDRDALRRAAAGATVVINAVGLTTTGHSKEEYEEANVTSTTNLLDASVDAGVEGFVHLSSTAMYGESLPSWPVAETWSFRPQAPLAQSLVMAERAARTYRRRIPLIVLRSALAFGPRDSGPVHQILLHFQDTRRPRLIDGGRQPVSLSYAPDLARAVWSTIDQLSETRDRIYHVKSIDSDWRSLAEETYSLLGRRARFVWVPYRLARAAQRSGTLGSWIVRAPDRVDGYLELVDRPHLIDDSRLRSTTGFAPLFGLRAALRQTLAYLGAERSGLRL